MKQGIGFLLLAGLYTPAFSEEQPPNFVIIFADDLGYQDVGCFGSPASWRYRWERIRSDVTIRVAQNLGCGCQTACSVNAVLSRTVKHGKLQNWAINPAARRNDVVLHQIQ